MSNSPYVPNSLRNKRKQASASDVVWATLACIVFAVPAALILGLLVLGFAALISFVGAPFMMAVVNGGLVTLGGVLGFGVHTVGFWGAFKLCFLSTALASIIGGTHFASSAKK